VRGQSLFEEVRIGQMIPGIRIYCVKGNLTYDAMITMPDISPVGIKGYNRMWSIVSYDPHNLEHQLLLSVLFP
jgi:hypothetical protein